MRHLFLLPFVFFANFACGAGGVTSSGGDSVAAEFVITARHIVEIIKSNKPQVVDPTRLLEIIDSTTVVSIEHVSLNGFERDAVNQIKLKRIVVGRQRWFETANQIGRRYTLVLHEYLHLMGIDDSNYRVSSLVFGANGKKRIEITCHPLEDVAEILGKHYELDYILYEDREVALVKSEDGMLAEFPSNQVLVTEVAIPGGGSGLLMVLHFGFLRNVQVPFSFSNPPTGDIPALTWDTLASGQPPQARSITCHSRTW